MPEGPDYAILSLIISEKKNPRITRFIYKTVDYSNKLSDKSFYCYSHGKLLCIVTNDDTLYIVVEYNGKIHYKYLDYYELIMDIKYEDESVITISISKPKLCCSFIKEFKPLLDSIDLLNREEYSDAELLTIIDKMNLNNRKIVISKAITEQKIIVGIGNFVKNEALFIAKIHPNSKCCNIPTYKLLELFKQIVYILWECFDNGGTISPKNTTKPHIYGNKSKEIIKMRTKDGRISFIHNSQMMY